MGKFADIIVVLGEGKQLEFTRRTLYQPMWRTQEGTYLVDDLFPGRDKDYEFDYNYVKLIENGPGKIVVQWRYFPYFKNIEEANRNLDALFVEGITGVVNEIFEIYPDGSIEREVKEAKGTSIEDWQNPDNTVRQTIQLKNNGIEHSPVDWGKQSEGGLPAIEGNPIKEIKRDNLVMHWRFDEGSEEHEDYIEESVDEGEASVGGMATLYKKGVSGTALAFDGYYSGVTTEEGVSEIKSDFTIEAWVALDVYPYNNAPVVHQSKSFGEKGFYLGVDAYGYPFITVNGITAKAKLKLPLYTWKRVAASVGKNTLSLFVDEEKVASVKFDGNFSTPEVPLVIGLNTETERCTDFVRTNDQNLPFILGIEGLIDEVMMYDVALSETELAESFQFLKPKSFKSDLKPALLPGETGKADKFGAYYTKLKFNELWDNMFRVGDYADIVVKFDKFPTSVVYWRGTNYAANWVTEKNQWMSDQSSEIFTKHGCSEHMADKQIRHCFAEIIENTPARVVIHWRYPCVDVSYYCATRRNWTDEYHTIYPDGTGIRKVVWNKGYDSPGFQDIQFFTNPGETPLDVVDLQAMTVANTTGAVQKLTWQKPNIIPKITINDACIELLKSKSEYKIFVIFQGGNITPWGAVEQSAYTDDPFAGPWNHWPTHLVPSDGRFAVAQDRVTHFALGANDAAPEFGSIVHYGVTNGPIESLVEEARYWKNPPQLIDFEGGESMGFDKSQKAYVFLLEDDGLSFKIDASVQSPLINPAFVIKGWNVVKNAIIKINGNDILTGEKCREGIERDTEGNPVKVIWIEMKSVSPVEFKIK